MLNVLIVDDSSFFQRRLKQIIDDHPKLKVIGMADNGHDAVAKVKSLKPDIVTMDYEMPMMDGVTAVRAIMAENPLPILMLSSMTYEGARITLDALEAGAMDFMTKNFSEISNNSPTIKKRIYDALLAIGADALRKKGIADDRKPQTVSSPTTDVKKATVTDITSATSKAPVRPATRTISARKPKIIVIGSSTGGPAALTELLKGIPSSFSLPILIIQHMPETFTKAFAERLDRQCQLTVKEGATGDELLPAHVYIAPGGKQLIIDSNNNSRIKIIDSTKPVNYKPCVDVTFASVCNTYGAESLAIVLTGMGQDGLDGAKLLKQKGAQIWTQCESSCLIYGMPMAIERNNLTDASLDLTGIQEKIIKL